MLKRAVLDQPTVDSGGVCRGRSVALAVGCWLFALQRHFSGTSTELPGNFHGTSTASGERFSVSRMRNFFYLGMIMHPARPKAGRGA